MAFPTLGSGEGLLPFELTPTAAIPAAETACEMSVFEGTESALSLPLLAVA